MGVYINMEMPKCCAECDAEGHYENSYGDEYGFFCPFGYKAYTEETRDAERLDVCPLVPVKPHGDLIDRDALRAEFPEPNEENGGWRNPDEALVHKTGVWAAIDAAPTVIEAEEKT